MKRPPVLAALGLSLIGPSAANAQSMTLTSADLKEGATIANEQVFNGFGCTGSNVSPALSWSGAPSGTKSFAITMYDPCRRCQKEADAQGRNPGPERLWRLWLWRPVPATRRQGAPLPDHGICS